MRRIMLIAAMTALPGLALSAVADDGMGVMPGHMAVTKTVSSSVSTQAFEAAAMTMHKGMAINYSGDTDVDFVRGMIAHHQGAIDMAKVELQYGKDPEVRKLAEAIVKAQTDEIKWMDGWLSKHMVK